MVILEINACSSIKLFLACCLIFLEINGTYNKPNYRSSKTDEDYFPNGGSTVHHDSGYRSGQNDSDKSNSMDNSLEDKDHKVGSKLKDGAIININSIKIQLKGKHPMVNKTIDSKKHEEVLPQIEAGARDLNNDYFHQTKKRPWELSDLDHRRFHVKLFSKCKTTKGNSCQFPFIYAGKQYETCTNVGNKGYPWCAVNKTTDGRVDMWGDCNRNSCDPELWLGEETEGRNSVHKSRSLSAQGGDADKLGEEGEHDVKDNSLDRGPLAFFVNQDRVAKIRSKTRRRRRKRSCCKTRCKKGRRGSRCRRCKSRIKCRIKRRG